MDNINELTDVACSYISFCVENVIDSKMVICHSNNKPWFNAELKNLLKKKSGDKVAYSMVRKEIRTAIAKAKYNYKEKIKYKLSHSDQRAVWNGMKLMTGLQECNRTMVF